MPPATVIPEPSAALQGTALQKKPQVWRFLTRAALLAAPFLLFLIAFEYWFAHANPSHLAVKKALLERQAQKIEVLILGSSHELTGINPAELGRPAFNLASQSQSIYYDTALVRKYRASLPALKLVILPVSYFSLEYELENAPERWRAFHYRYFYSLPHQDWHKLFSLRNFSTYFLSSESFRARVLLGKAPNASLEYDPWGGWTNRPQPAPANPDNLASAAQVTLRTHEAMMHKENLPKNLARLRALAGDLRQNDINVILITSPVTRFYAAGLKPQTYARMQNALQQFATDEHLPYRNYMLDPRFTDSDFVDGDHLNPNGAHKFTRILREDIASMGFAGYSPR